MHINVCFVHYPRVFATQYFCAVFTKNCCCCLCDAICETQIDVVNYNLIYILPFPYLEKNAYPFSKQKYLIHPIFYILNEDDCYWQRLICILARQSWKHFCNDTHIFQNPLIPKGDNANVHMCCCVSLPCSIMWKNIRR